MLRSLVGSEMCIRDRLNRSQPVAQPDNYDLLAPITKLSFMRGGVLFPLQFQIDENEVIVSNPTVADEFAGSSFEAQRQYYYAMSIRPRTSPATDQLAGQNTENLATANGDEQHECVTGSIINTDPCGFQNVYGIGMRVGAVSLYTSPSPRDS